MQIFGFGFEILYQSLGVFSSHLWSIKYEINYEIFISII